MGIIFKSEMKFDDS